MSHDLLDDITSSSQHRIASRAQIVSLLTHPRLLPRHSLPLSIHFHCHKESHRQRIRPPKYPLLELLFVSVSAYYGDSNLRDEKLENCGIKTSGARSREHSRGIVVGPEVEPKSRENSVTIETIYEEFRMRGRSEMQCAEREVPTA